MRRGRSIVISMMTRTEGDFSAIWRALRPFARQTEFIRRLTARLLIHRGGTMTWVEGASWYGAAGDGKVASWCITIVTFLELRVAGNFMPAEDGIIWSKESAQLSTRLYLLTELVNICIHNLVSLSYVNKFWVFSLQKMRSSKAGITKHSHGRSTTDRNIILLLNVIHPLDTIHFFLIQPSWSSLCTNVSSWCIFCYQFFALGVNFVVWSSSLSSHFIFLKVHHYWQSLFEPIPLLFPLMVQFHFLWK